MKTRLCLLLAALVTSSSFAARPPPGPPLLAPGTVAPDFTALTPNNKPVKLSDFKGSVVLVDFWATWCGPCKIAMPHMEKLHKALAAQGLIVLGVCVWEDRGKFDAWQKRPEVPTTYQKVFDPAAKNTNNSIAKKLYNVSGIPSFYLIDKDGKVAFSDVGAGPNTEARLDEALKQLGFKL